MQKFTRLLILFLSLACLLSAAQADEIVLKESHPTQYVVKEGDTLWDIASRFLRDPWRWPDIWYVNPQIENPHLIYPGDAVELTYKDGRPQLKLRRAADKDKLRVVKMSPTVRSTTLTRAIPTIPLDAVQQFLSRPRVVTEAEVQAAPYIVSSLDEHLIAGAGDVIYARGVVPGAETRYTVYRTDRTYKDVRNGETRILGHEAVFVGDAVLKRHGDPSTLEVIGSAREVLIGDRLMPAVKQDLEFNFIPRAPENRVQGRIIDVVDGVSYIGQFQTVVINLGRDDGMERGHVLAVHQSGATVRDVVAEGESLVLPSELAGYLMVFRPFDKVSYALVMQSQREMRLQDEITNP